MRTVTIPNKQIELTETEVEQAVKDLARQKAEEKTVPLINGSCAIFPVKHPMWDVIQIRAGGQYEQRGLYLDAFLYSFALVPDESGHLVLTVTKKAETR